jgi:tungstate transport system ATP-binding protein
MNPNVSLITGTICGYRVEDIEDEILRKVRYLDKLVDELAKGKVMEKKMGIVTVSVSGREVAVIGDYAVGENLILCIRPENVTLSIKPSDTPTSARNTFPGTIERIVPMGLFQKVELNCGFPLVAYVTHDSIKALSLCEEMGVSASFKATAIHVVRK